MNKKRNPLKWLGIIAGFVCLGLGTVGIVLPLLPTVPFYMATGFFFAKSSERLHSWFIKTGFYKRYMVSFIERKAMTMKAKCSIVIIVTLVMAIGFIMMNKVPIGRVFLTVVWIGHLLYFFIGIKTIKVEREEISER